MTAYEATELFLGYLNTYSQFMFGYVGILSGFLVMSYVAGHRISKLLSILVLALFTLVSSMLIIQINFLRNDFTEINLYLFELKNADPESLMWFGTNPSWMIPVLTWITNAVLFGGFAGCVAYFLYQRQESSRDVGK